MARSGAGRQNGRRIDPERMMRKLLICLAAMLWTWPALAQPAFQAVEIPTEGGVMLKAKLFLPQGTPVAPAIVALHGCGGAYPSRDRQWQELLVGRGHIMLFPDSFGSRGLGSQCRNQHRTVTSFVVRRRDAIDSAKWLAARPETPKGGVALLGWSDGGSTVVSAGHEAADLPTGLIRGSVGFYAGCTAGLRTGGWTPAGRMLLLMGAADDWVPLSVCQRLADRVAPPALTLVAYPGAYHDFDAPGGVRVMQNIPSSQNGDKSVHAGTNPAAQAAVLALVPAFLEGLAPVSP
jgi:dienelactone hydrolase